MKTYFGITIFFISLFGFEGLTVAQHQVELAKDGKTQLSVVLAEHTPDRVRSVATDLSLYLGRISGAEFLIRTGDGRESFCRNDHALEEVTFAVHILALSCL